jgi:hypothetical protein
VRAVNEFSMPLGLFREIVRLARWPLRLRAAWNRWGEHRELLLRPMTMRSPQFVQVWVGEDLPRIPDRPDNALGILSIGRGAGRGHAIGAMRDGEAWAPIDRLRLVGPGMHVINIAPDSLTHEDDTVVEVGLAARWSRTVGALGEAPWRRLASLGYGIIGAGRSGSLLARSISDGWGAQDLTIVDPDMIAVHNLGESDLAIVERAELGRAKVDILADRLRKSRSDCGVFRVTPVCESILQLRALRAVQTCDVFFVAVDHDGPRLAASALAALFMKPLIDIATGIHGTGDERRMGADVRLVMPGRCLLCFGGLADLAAARRMIGSPETEREFLTNRDWRRERQGSLRSLNQLAVSIALRLWEDLVSERVTESVWVHLDFSSDGQIRLEDRRHVPAPAPCNLCALMGSGEAGMESAARVILGLD